MVDKLEKFDSAALDAEILDLMGQQEIGSNFAVMAIYFGGSSSEEYLDFAEQVNGLG